jgi:hypothetical protein
MGAYTVLARPQTSYATYGIDGNIFNVSYPYSIMYTYDGDFSLKNFFICRCNVSMKIVNYYIVKYAFQMIINSVLVVKIQ